MLKIFVLIFSFINQKIFRNTKEDSILKGGLFSILYATFKHDMRFKLGSELKLQYPNNTLQFPLPNRWSNEDKTLSKQKKYMLTKQVSLKLKPAGIKERNIINQDPDRSQSSMNVMKLTNTIRKEQIDQVSKIATVYDVLSDPIYIKDRETLFADSLVNGEHSYMLRKYGNQYYELPKSKKVDQSYRKALITALETQTWNDNSKVFDLSRQEILKRISSGEGVYSMLFEHLQFISKGKVIENRPEIYIDNQLVDQIHYLHVPYPIFLKIKGQKGKAKFICIAIGFRLNGVPTFFSPFFANQGERLWRLTQSHLAQVVLNDFSVRVHLGIYHFTTNQYHVPVYRLLQKLKGKKKRNFKLLLDNSYTLFSRGLEGVNLGATASLVHQDFTYSLVNKVFNLSQQNAIAIIALHANNVKIYQYDPKTMMEKQGINSDQIKQNFDKMALDFELYQILSEYIQQVFKNYQSEDIIDKLLTEINEQTKNMAVGAGNAPRSSLKTKEDVLKTIKNLCFCWVGFHSHTFSTISFATYPLFRPSMLKTPIPSKQQWENIQIGEELPDSKILMETGKLNELTTQRDSDNFLMDSMRRIAQSSAYQSKFNSNDATLSELYKNQERIAWKTFKRLQDYENRVLQCNAQRRRQKGSISFEWMDPSSIQTSLNI